MQKEFWELLLFDILKLVINKKIQAKELRVKLYQQLEVENKED